MRVQSHNNRRSMRASQRLMEAYGASPDVTKSDSLSVASLSLLAGDWIKEAERIGHSANTIELKQSVMDKFTWFLRDRGFEHVETDEIRQFLHYVQTQKSDRFGNTSKGGQITRPLKPAACRVYYAGLKSFYAWLISEGALSQSPFDRIKPPVVQAEPILPFEKAQVKALIKAARETRVPLRDEAIIMTLLDTGLRVSELCSVKHKDVNLPSRHITVSGKGSKTRNVYFGAATARLLTRMRHAAMSISDGRDIANEPLFPSFGEFAGQHMTREGVRFVIKRLADKAGIEGVRCSPHTFRHTFAVNFLRNGGDLFSLMMILGHSSLTVTQIYLHVASDKVAESHAKFSPGDSIGR